MSNKPSQDYVYTDKLKVEDREFILNAVFDGHGGHKVADFAKSFLVRNIKQYLKTYQFKFQVVFQKLIDSIDWNLSQNSIYYRQGTTSLLTLIYHNNLFVSNLGDCELHLMSNGKMKRLNHIHNIRNEEELKNIKDKFRNEPKEELVERGYFKGCLQLTRSLGDYYLKDPKSEFCKHTKVESYPYVTIKQDYYEVNLMNKSKPIDYIILASDGFWDEYRSEKDYADLEANIKDGKFQDAKALLQYHKDKIIKRHGQGVFFKTHTRHIFDDTSIIFVKVKVLERSTKQQDEKVRDQILSEVMGNANDTYVDEENKDLEEKNGGVIADKEVDEDIPKTDSTGEVVQEVNENKDETPKDITSDDKEDDDEDGNDL